MRENASGSALSCGGSPFSEMFAYMQYMERVEAENNGFNPKALFTTVKDTWKFIRDLWQYCEED